ncbi:hypothetical protein LIER_36149 [Lithospermum erythrorhizon]|uniref:Endoplasmic reticulum vesicle transporter C-terminal domain-containing protein n=1 Tax=Lithospermum erythrorhizon TaxID=34254 RepID=A0AAV3P303_LITER
MALILETSHIPTSESIRSETVIWNSSTLLGVIGDLDQVCVVHLWCQTLILLPLLISQLIPLYTISLTVIILFQCKREGFIQKVKDEEGEGCNIHGSLEVNRVAGNFYFAIGKSIHQSSFNLQDLLDLQSQRYNISHKINNVAFGDYVPGVVNPLDGVSWMQGRPHGMYEYFIKVVPTIYTDIRGHTIDSNQFSVTEHYKTPEEGRSVPGVFFFYDLSPIKVTFTEEHVSFLHFLTNVCAIVGGVYTVAGIVDSFVYHSQRAIKKKMEIGKFR